MAFPWEAAIAGGANILGRFIGGRQQKSNIKRTNKANLRLARKAHERNLELAQFGYDKDIEMWKMQNQYNSPAAQMQRFEDAGLSKHMIYGQGTPGNATGMPTFNQPQYNPPMLDYRGQPNPTAEALGEFMGTAGDVMDLQIGQQDLNRKEQEAGISKLNRQIRSMDIPGANLKYLIDKETTRQLANMPESEWSSIIRGRISARLSSDQQQVLAQKLKNKYQKVVNTLAEQGITLGDQMYIRIATLILNNLGFDNQSIIDEMNQPVSAEDAQQMLKY